jgi:hypothetical protein
MRSSDGTDSRTGCYGGRTKRRKSSPSSEPAVGVTAVDIPRSDASYPDFPPPPLRGADRGEQSPGIFGLERYCNVLSPLTFRSRIKSVCGRTPRRLLTLADWWKSFPQPAPFTRTSRTRLLGSTAFRLVLCSGSRKRERTRGKKPTLSQGAARLYIGKRFSAPARINLQFYFACCCPSILIISCGPWFCMRLIETQTTMYRGRDANW